MRFKVAVVVSNLLLYCTSQWMAIVCMFIGTYRYTDDPIDGTPSNFVFKLTMLSVGTLIAAL